MLASLDSPLTPPKKFAFEFGENNGGVFVAEFLCAHQRPVVTVVVWAKTFGQ